MGVRLAAEPVRVALAPGARVSMLERQWPAGVDVAGGGVRVVSFPSHSHTFGYCRAIFLTQVKAGGD